MSDYTQITDFSAKDALSTGNAAKIVKGVDFDAEFSAIETAIASKADYTELQHTLIPRITSYTAGTAPGSCVAVTAGFTLDTALAAGTSFLIYNNSASSILITQGSGLTLRTAGTTITGNVTIPPRGLATVWVNSTTEYILSGSGVY